MAVLAAPMTHARPAGDAVVLLSNVAKTYRSGTVEVAALKGVTLEIPARSFTMIIGPSGSGKTTLLNLIGCIDRPSEGSVTVCGQDAGVLDDDRLSDFRARHIGFVFQGFSLVPVLTAFENVEYPLLLIGMPARERRERARAMLDAIGLTAQAERLPNELSGGQKQRVAIGRALVKEPDLVLADEPTANLDSGTGAQIIDLMHQIQNRYRTSFVFSTHDPRLMSHADATFAIRDGVLVDSHGGETA